MVPTTPAFLMFRGKPPPQHAYSLSGILFPNYPSYIRMGINENRRTAINVNISILTINAITFSNPLSALFLLLAARTNRNNPNAKQTLHIRSLKNSL